MDILIVFVAVLIGAILGWNLREAVAMLVVKKVLGELDQYEDPKSEQTDERIPITIERHNNTFYVYSREKNEFMAQGSTRAELETVLAERFPGKRFAVDEKTLSELGTTS